MVKMKRKAFTIAELMVAMIIIGAIGIILMPMIMSDNEKQVLKVSLEKTYASLKQSAQAISLLTARGKITPGTTAMAKMITAINESQKLMPDGKTDNYLSGYNLVGDNKIAVLRNGIIITVETETETGTETNYIIVDVNGIKKPNVVGRDIYYFEVKDANNGEVSFEPAPYDGENCKKDGTEDNNIGCADFYLNQGGKL